MYDMPVMAEGKKNVALIEKNDLEQFLETTNDLNLKINENTFNIRKKFTCSR